MSDDLIPKIRVPAKSRKKRNPQHYAGKTKITYRCDEALARDLKVLAAKRGTTVTQLLDEAVGLILKRYDE